jgi:hypothetical protein
MTIYATPFRTIDRQLTGLSTDSGFDKLDTVVATMGEPLAKSERTAVYGDDENRVIFSDYPFCIDEENINA